MADNNMTFSNPLMQPGGEDFLRELTEFMLNRIMEADVTQSINAERHECSYERETYRNGYRDRQYNTRPGTQELRIPKLREGSYFPSFPEARRLSEKALNAAIQEAGINGVSTRKVSSICKAREWVHSFIRWYNTQHRHSGIKFVTPEQRHPGLDKTLLKQRKVVCETARCLHPERWSGKTRNWTPIEIVALNPENERRAA
ncbi:hypothetical protein IB305_004828 [Salmonella enterica]|nr:hypothetical protein [Salmonella enterica]